MGQTNSTGYVYVGSGQVDNGDFISGPDFLSGTVALGEWVESGGTAISTTVSGYIELEVDSVGVTVSAAEQPRRGTRLSRRHLHQYDAHHIDD
jgi:hypothetical protein